MQSINVQEFLEDAIRKVEETSPQQTDGTWLEDLTVTTAPFIREWDIEQCYPWSDWSEQQTRFKGLTKQDIGIDAVGIRRDGDHIAIQCKSRQLDELGRGNPITKEETDSFASASADEFWAERWIVTNGNNQLSNNFQQTLSMTSKPIKLVNITNDLLQQRSAFIEEECPHCKPDAEDGTPRQTRSCMQNEAIAESVRILREHLQSNSGGLPVGQARGKVILPCGTGKTRISLRIVEELTSPGELSIVLCPSIALVAQIRREYLQNQNRDIRALAVCSDETAGYDPDNEGDDQHLRQPYPGQQQRQRLRGKGQGHNRQQGNRSMDPAGARQ